VTNSRFLDGFLGYRRPDGPPGVRNHLAIVSLSGLEHSIAHALHRQFPQAVLVATTYGRGHVGDDRVFQRHMMSALATHPNVGGAVIIGPDRGLVENVCDAVVASGRPVEGISLVDAGEDRFELLQRSARAAARLTHRLSRAIREPCTPDELAIAVECGHSGATSGIVANPLAGALAVVLVAAGGRALFSETLEWTGTGDILAERARTPDVAAAIREALKRRHETAKAGGHDFHKGNPGPQNHAGGITTLEEKSLGAIAKGGDQPIEGLIGEGERLPEAPGLYLMDTPCLSPASITSMIASGAQNVLFTTDQGNPYGSAIAPTI
jgi:altronate dehydratase large subunit